MTLVPAEVELTFEVTFDANGLNVALSVYDTSGVTPLLVQGPSAMSNIIGYTYIGKFTPTAGRNYLIYKAVYTDNTFTVLDSNYSQGSESIIAEIINPQIDSR